VNTGGGTIAVTNATSTLTLSGAIGGANLSKTGAGTLHLTGTLGGTGSTTVTAGVLRVNPVTASGGFVVQDGATLAVNAGTGTASFSAPTFTLSGANPTVRFELNTASLPTAPLISVGTTNGLTGGGTLALVNQQPLATGTYTLFSYTGTQINSGFSLQLAGRTAGSLNYSTVGQINAVITGTDTIKWGGQVNGTWDVGTAANVGGTNNWRLNSNNNSTNFIDTDTVTFDDTASGNFAVNIVATVNPTLVTVNNSTNDYTFSGAGAISGNGGLTKSGSSRLTIATANSFTGGTTLNAGVLQLGNGGTTGDVGSGSLSIAGGSVEFNRSAAHTFNNAITVSAATSIQNLGTGDATIASTIALGANDFGFGGTGNTIFTGAIGGTGNITKSGAGTVTLLANNSFTGTLTINGGTVLLNDTGLGGDLNAASIVVNNTGTFHFGDTGGVNPDLPANTVITVNAGGTARFTIGEDYGAFNLNGGTYNSNVNNNLGQTSTLQSGTIGNINSVNGSIAGAGLVQKTTSGTVTITGVALNGTGGLNIDEGTLSTDSGIGGSGIIRIGNVAAATLEYRGAAATVSRNITLDTFGGNVGVSATGGIYTLSGVLSGNGTLTKSGVGTLVLSGANNYVGTTAVNSGTVLVNGNSSAATGAITVTNTGTLGGSGTIGGATTVQSGGRIVGGNGTDTGTLATQNVTIQSGGILAANIAASGTSSNLNVAGNTLNIATGSILNLTGLTGFTNASNGTYTLATLTGNTLQLDGAATTDGQQFGTFIQGTGASGAVTIDMSNFGQTLANGDKLTLSRTGNSLILTFVAVPEPATIFGASLALIAVGGLIRRRLNRSSTLAT
jgi:autotransporter-associated beta strand protein